MQRRGQSADPSRCSMPAARRASVQRIFPADGRIPAQTGPLPEVLSALAEQVNIESRRVPGVPAKLLTGVMLLNPDLEIPIRPPFNSAARGSSRKRQLFRSQCRRNARRSVLIAVHARTAWRILLLDRRFPAVAQWKISAQQACDHASDGAGSTIARTGRPSPACELLAQMGCGRHGVGKYEVIHDTMRLNPASFQ